MSRINLRVASGAAVVAISLGLGACGAPEPMSTDEVIALIEKESGGDDGEIYAQRILVKRENGEHDEITVFIVHRPDGSTVLIDSNGQRYEPSLEDFLDNNHLFSPEDSITLPRDFPNAPQTGPFNLMTISGHTSSSWGWWLGGGGVLVAVMTAGGVLWIRSRRRTTDTANNDPTEPE